MTSANINNYYTEVYNNTRDITVSGNLVETITGNHSITVNNILPGYTNTKRLESLIQKKSESSGESINVVKQKMINSVPAKRFGEPEEVAHLVSFLISSKASYINGTNIVIDGGRTASL